MPRPSAPPSSAALVALIGVFLWTVFGLFAESAPALAQGASQETAALPIPVTKAAVLSARLGLHPDKTRFVLEVSDAVPFTATVQTAPHGVSLELPELAWPDAPKGRAGTGLVKRYNFTVSDSGGRRLLLETAGPVRLREAFLIPPREGHRARIVLDIERVPAADRAVATALPVPAPKLVTPPAEPDAPIAVTPVAAMTAPLPPPTPSRVPRASGKPLIVIDAGHGGVDPGAIGIGGVHEKDITLAMAQELKRQLDASGRYRVRLTRDTDVFIRLRDRVAIAREAGADLFLSLHADSIGSGSIRGLSVYTLSDKASDREAEMLAAKENRSDAIAGLNLVAENDQVVSILIDLAQRETMNQSKRFANTALQSLKKTVSLLSTHPHRQAGFAVLTAPDVPSALIEMGYLSSSKDADLLTSPQYRQRLGTALIGGIDGYFKWLDTTRRS